MVTKQRKSLCVFVQLAARDLHTLNIHLHSLHLALQPSTYSHIPNFKLLAAWEENGGQPESYHNIS